MEGSVQEETDKASTAAQQKRGVRTTIAVIAVFIIAVMAGFINKITTPRVLSDMELRANGTFVFEKPRIFKNFNLVDHKGRPFTLQQLEGKWSLVFFGFASCPDVCPTTLALLKQARQQLNDDMREQVQVVMVTVDPARDDVAVLNQYMTHFDPEFIGLTGEFLEIKRLATQLSASFVKVRTGDHPDDYTVDHSANVLLVNPRGHFHGFIKPPLQAPRIKLSLQSLATRFDG